MSMISIKLQLHMHLYMLRSTLLQISRFKFRYSFTIPGYLKGWICLKDHGSPRYGMVNTELAGV